MVEQLPKYVLESCAFQCVSIYYRKAGIHGLFLHQCHVFSLQTYLEPF
jgi:hypothetical protein